MDGFLYCFDSPELEQLTPTLSHSRMKLTTYVLAAVLTLTSTVSAKASDIFDPPILYPHAGTVWFAGQYHNVTWDTTGLPPNVDNITDLAFITLVNFVTQIEQQTLAEGFSLLDGRVQIQVPADTPADTNYRVTLYGDSGNFSPVFTIDT